MDAALLLGHRHALHAVHAALVFQLAVDLVAADQRDDFLQPAHGRFAAGGDFHLPALRFRVARVHAEDLGGEERGFVAARAGADFEHHVLLVVGVLGQQQDLEFFFDARRSAAPARAISSSAMALSSGSVSWSMARACERLSSTFFHSRYLATISESSLCALVTLRYWSRVADHGRIGHLLGELVKAFFELIELLERIAWGFRR